MSLLGGDKALVHPDAGRVRETQEMSRVNFVSQGIDALDERLPALRRKGKEGRGRKVAQWVKHSPYKHEKLSPNP